MKIETVQLTEITISELERIDGISVITKDYKPGVGEITIKSYNKIWNAYWGAMSGKTVSQFFRSCDNDYLIKNMAGGLYATMDDPNWEPQEDEHGDYRPQQVPNPEYEWLSKIVDVVKASLQELEVTA